jgi:hypothetical protein
MNQMAPAPNMVSQLTPRYKSRKTPNPPTGSNGGTKLAIQRKRFGGLQLRK